ncbi:MAG: MFS transporter, partial [Micromonosporaceae bacterium]|nr:MFS transporter [Micromonosporaceae bacterium]
MPAFRLACLVYFTTALPGSTLGMLWPSIRLTLHQPVGALGGPLALGVAASVLSSIATGRLLSRIATGPLLAAGTVLCGLALAVEAAAPLIWPFLLGMVLFGFGWGAVDTALNGYAAHRFGARQITWMHASYGVGATAGPLLVTAMLGASLSWRWVVATMAVILVLVAAVLLATRRALPAAVDRTAPDSTGPDPAADPAPPAPHPGAVLGSLAFTAVETGIESGAGIWGYVFLTGARGLAPAAAGAAISGYWAMMFAGRVVLGMAAERLGAARVLAAAVIGVSAGAALMAVPAPGAVAVAGLMLLGLAAAPIFPLFTLTTGARLGTAGGSATARTVGLQVAA